MLNYLLAILSAVFCAIMVLASGRIGLIHGVFQATVIIHMAGLVLISLVLILKRESLRILRQLPPIAMIGGAVGVGTTLFSTYAYGELSVSAIIAISLLSQSVLSLLTDQYGWFHMPKQTGRNTHPLGLFFVLGGIVFLLFGSKASLLPVLAACGIGICIVASRSLNGWLGLHSGIWVSTWVNYAVGLTVSALLFGISLWSGATHILFPGWNGIGWLGLATLSGVTLVAILNGIASRIPAFTLTLILFIFQVFAGIGLDWLVSGEFSGRNLLGGGLVAVGFLINGRRNRKTQPVANEATHPI